MEKAEIRKQMRALKAEMKPWDVLRRSADVMRQLESLDDFKRAKVVLMYWSMDDEVQTHAFVEQWYDKKTILLPCVDGDILRLRQYTGPLCMVPGEQFGIPEPAGEEWTDMDAIDMIAVPGVAFDQHNNRMGRGRGFYDRLLKLTQRAVTVGLAYSFQVLNEIPVEAHDVPMNIVISD